jgi:hypothetical protein
MEMLASFEFTVECNERRAPRSNIRCELPADHGWTTLVDDRPTHVGRSAARGQWYTWADKEGPVARAHARQARIDRELELGEPLWL